MYAKEIIHLIHNNRYYRVTKTEAIIRQDFYMPNLRKQIENGLRNLYSALYVIESEGKAKDC